MLPQYRKPQVFNNFLTEDECDYLIQKAKNNMGTSSVTTEKKVDETVRKSETAWLKSDDPIVRDIMDRCLTNTDRPFTNCEQLQVLRYESGGFTNPIKTHLKMKRI